MVIRCIRESNGFSLKFLDAMVAAEDKTFWSKLIKSPLAKKLFANVPKLEWFGEWS